MHNPEGETYGFFSIEDLDGRVSSLEWSDKHPYHLRVVGVLPHGSEIRPRTIRDAQKIGEWFSEQANRWGPFAENPPVGVPTDVLAMVNPDDDDEAEEELLEAASLVVYEIANFEAMTDKAAAAMRALRDAVDLYDDEDDD